MGLSGAILCIRLDLALARPILAAIRGFYFAKAISLESFGTARKCRAILFFRVVN